MELERDIRQILAEKCGGEIDLATTGIIALITAARRPALPDREAVARVIDPSSWQVMDSYLAEVKRKHPNSGYDPDNFKCRGSLTKADAILAMLSPAQAEREGWVMVPREPTEAMILAGAYGRRNGWRESTKATYQGMLSAAPKVTT